MRSRIKALERTVRCMAETRETAVAATEAVMSEWRSWLETPDGRAALDELHAALDGSPEPTSEPGDDFYPTVPPDLRAMLWVARSTERGRAAVRDLIRARVRIESRVQAPARDGG
jgi:hypothetical protein